jgi:ribosome biogenesis GTPase / thiamine phosphate phosphatase
LTAGHSELLISFGWGKTFEQGLEALQDPGLEPGRVVASSRDVALVQTAAGELWCRPTGRFRDETETRGVVPCAGDWIALRRYADGSGGAVEALLPRRSVLERAEAGGRARRGGGRSRAQALAANIDFVFLLMGLDGNWNPARMERLAALAWSSGAQPVAVLTKADLAENPAARAAGIEAVAPGVPVHAISAVSGTGLEPLRAVLAAGTTGVLIGSSGVGKSTLLNCLAGAELRRTAEVRASDSRGRHTTSLRELFALPGGGCLIDTPGLREIGLHEDDGGVEQAFADVAALAGECRFRDCTHGGEPGCAVIAALEAGTLSADRYESYLRLRREARHAASRNDERLRRERDAWGKSIAKQVRNFDKSRRG